MKKLRTLNVQAPASFARRLMAQSLPRFLHEHPGLRVVVWDMNPADEMLAHDADAAICIGPTTNPDLVVNKIGAVRSITCASPEFIECTGVPELPSDVPSDHCWRARSWHALRAGVAVSQEVGVFCDLSQSAPGIQRCRCRNRCGGARRRLCAGALHRCRATDRDRPADSRAQRLER
jgi:DNA-binding transcriptional LysR family regulator